jgi:hypothetical protein
MSSLEQSHWYEESAIPISTDLVVLKITLSVADYLRSKQVPFSLILTSFYYSNLVSHGVRKPPHEYLSSTTDPSLSLTTQFLRKDGDEFFVEFPIPSTSKIASFDPAETGSWVRSFDIYTPKSPGTSPNRQSFV